MAKKRVLIVDDSAAVRQAMSEIINADPDLEVMATANDPVQAVKRIKSEVPDVMTLDVEMPKMDGITFLKRIMAQHPIPVVMCSTLVEENSKTLLDALEAGAVDIICKPTLGTNGFFGENSAEICSKIKAAASLKIGAKPRAAKVQKKLTADEILPPPRAGAMTKTTEHVVAVGASTGGTEALRIFLEALPADCPAIAIVQHMPAGFTAAFAKRLNQICKIDVKEAADGDRMLRGRALISPGGKHMLVNRKGAQYVVELRDGPLVSRHKPSVDVLFRSVARTAGSNAIGVIMTGMGDDGARGLGEMRSAGARTLGQDEATSVVYGMPKAAFEAGAVERQAPLHSLSCSVMSL